MKFGKKILAERIPGWSEYYLDYKALKKIVSSVDKQSGPSDAFEDEQILATTGPLESLNPSASSSAPATSIPPLWETMPPSQLATDTPLSTTIAASSSIDHDRSPDFQMKKAAFFFKLQRELDKINTFYLQKEAELKLRLTTLLSKRRAAASRVLPDSDEMVLAKDHVEWSAVIEGFTLLQNDLLKLQQFVDINAIGFRKILKKWDKKSRSATKELYLTRQVEVQPVFNRQLITEFSDTVAACLLNLTDPNAPVGSTLQEEPSRHDAVLNAQIVREPPAPSRAFLELEDTLRKAITNNDVGGVQHGLTTAKELISAPDGKTYVARILWKAAIDAEPNIADLILDSPNSPCDFKFVDDINGRTCLHEAAAASGSIRLINMCIAKGVDVNRRDLYDRTPLHYAVINGHDASVARLLEAGADPTIVDMDNFSCLYYAVVFGHLECVRILLTAGGVGVEPKQKEDKSPLSLACQYGHLDIALLLLQHGAKQVPNSNGEYPIHLAAGAGHAEICRLLAIRASETLDIPDKYNEWTPLFHAAHKGRESVVRVLLEYQCNPCVTDELGRMPVFYSGWYGHIGCVSLLLDASAGRNGEAIVLRPKAEERRTTRPDTQDMDAEFIPSLLLPPPIMPFRIYGHNYLDKQYLIQITLGQPYSKYHLDQTEPSVTITPWTSTFAGTTINNRPESLLKMVMTSRTSEATTPISLTLPLSGERDVFTFQVQDLSELSLEFSFFPQIGSKTIGRAAVLPTVFENIKDSKEISLAILDHKLHIIGKVIFEACIIRPFEDVTLQLGGAVETYWKSSSQYPDRSVPGVLPMSTPSLIGSAHTSPSIRSAVMHPSGCLTISSLSHDFLHVVVQSTRDVVPVVFSEWNIPTDELNFGVSDITLAQFQKLAARTGKTLNVANAQNLSINQWAERLIGAMWSLESLLAILPAELGLMLHVAYPNKAIREAYSVGHHLDLNHFVDSVLRVVYRAASTQSRRRIAFLSFSPSVCTALNWKQPNYPVFFGSHGGLPEEERAKWRPPRPEPEKDRRCISVASAVEFAHANNLLGVFLNASLLKRIPALIQGIKDQNLLLGAFGSVEDIEGIQNSPGHPQSRLDGTLNDLGIAQFVDNTDMAV